MRALFAQRFYKTHPKLFWEIAIFCLPVLMPLAVMVAAGAVFLPFALIFGWL